MAARRALVYRMTFPLRGLPKPRDGHRNPWDRRHDGWHVFMQEIHLRARAMWEAPMMRGWVRLWITMHFDSDHRGDWDNIGGSVSDALQNVAYKNDRQVLDGRVIVVLGSSPERIEVELQELR